MSPVKQYAFDCSKNTLSKRINLVSDCEIRALQPMSQVPRCLELAGGGVAEPFGKQAAAKSQYNSLTNEPDRKPICVRDRRDQADWYDADYKSQ
jgi:hypothetical protein